MQRRSRTLLFTLALFPICVLAAGDGYEKITWADFEGTAPAQPGAERANIAMGQTSKYTVPAKRQDDGTYKATVKGGVTPFMDKANSWVVEAAKSPALLEHEQYHLDLHYFWSNVTNAMLGTVCESNSDRLVAKTAARDRAEAIIDAGFQLCSVIQSLYDTTTAHGTNPDAQAAWCWLIGTMINPRGGQEEVAEVECEGEVETGGGQEFIPTPPALQIPDVQISNFTTAAGTTADPVLGLHQWQFPRLEFAGYYMGSTHARLFTLDSDRTVVLARGTDAPILEGELLHMMSNAAGTTYRAWISPVTIQDRAAQLSPFLAHVQDGLMHRRLLVLELQMPQSIESLTAGWTQSAGIPLQVRIGTAEVADACDVNFDGAVDMDDVVPFRQLLAGTYPYYFPWAGDANGDGVTNGDDIDPFLERVQN